MGCLFGARLSPFADVVLFGHWPEQIRALQRAPLCILLPDGREECVQLRVTGDLAAVNPVDVALILTKAPKTEVAAQDAARVLSPEGLAITLQNGIGNLDVLARVLGHERVALGVTMQGASTGGQPGRLHYGGGGPTVLATRPMIDARVRTVATLFERANLQTEVMEDVTALVWGKLAINTAINPLTAILRVPNGALVNSEWAGGLMDQAAREVATIAAAQQITLPFADAAAQARKVARHTAHNRSSMLQDVQRGTQTEIEMINGAVVRTGATLGISTPVNRVLYELVKAIEGTLDADRKNS